MKTLQTDSDPPKSRRSVAELVKSFASDTATLLKQEIRLFRVELTENVRAFFRHASELALGGGVAIVGLLVLIAFAIVGLGGLLGGEYWLSALIVALVLLGAGGLMVLRGVRRLSRTNLVPAGTIESVRTSGEWAKAEAAELRGAIAGDGASVRRPAPAAIPDGAGSDAVALETRPGVDGGGSTGDEARGPIPRPPADPRASLAQPLFKRVLHEIQADDVLGQAAKVAYFMFMSLPPALLVVFALAGIYGGERLGSFLAEQLQGALPGSAADPNSAAGFVSQFIDQVVQTSAPAPLSIGLVVGIWAASAVFVALTDSLNMAYDVSDERSWFRRRALAIGVMIAFLLLFLVGSVVLLAGPQIAGALQLGGAADLAWTVLQWPLAFALVVLAFFVAYYALPNRDQSRCRWALLKGSAIAAGLWLLATLGFRLYIANFGSYGETYGFVGAILVLLLWMYITSIVILVGGEIASEMERGAQS